MNKTFSKRIDSDFVAGVLMVTQIIKYNQIIQQLTLSRKGQCAVSFKYLFIVLIFVRTRGE
jgi:hypothetical protein